MAEQWFEIFIYWSFSCFILIHELIHCNLLPADVTVNLVVEKCNRNDDLKMLRKRHAV